ncbi:potassium channel, sub T, member 2 [Mortierella sp. AM989]|nr:potassium channel, sub T, member 2 [Mortierella sp. AM989]
MDSIPDKSSAPSPSIPISLKQRQSAPLPLTSTQPTLHPSYSTPSPNNQVPCPPASTQPGPLPTNSPNGQEHQDLPEDAAYGSTLTWTQRLNYLARNQYIEPQGFIWDSLDNSMEDVQKARQMRKSGPISLIIDRKDTSYNALRSTFRLQNAEKRKSDMRNIVSLIRLVLDYDLYKARMMALLNSKARIIIFIMMDLVVDVLFCILYLIEVEYLINKDSTDHPEPKWLFIVRPRPIWITAVVMSSWNLMSALIRFIFADNNWSVISRLQRALSIGVDIGVSALIANFIAILYNGMAAFLYTETMFAPKTEAPHSVGDALYFILITASTVGYGDITPKSFEGKIVVMVFIIVALSIVPGLIAGTIDTLKSSRLGGGSYIQSRGANGVAKKYLVMIGDFQSAKRVSDMISGFLNKEFSDSEVRVVFLSRNKPSKDVKTLLDMPMHKNRTTMLVGNGLDEFDLKRCQVRDASAVFVIPVKSDLESQDTMTTLLAWSLHLYAPDTRIFTYNFLPETESFQWGIVEQSMCINDVKQLLLAYNCRHRGTATLILNLLHPSEPSNSYDDGWKAQYGDGTGNEIYVGSVPEVFIGWTFAQASWFVYQEFQSILVGVDIFLKHDKLSSDYSKYKPMSDNLPKSKFNHNRESQEHCPEGRYHLTLNPGNSYLLGKFDQLVFIAQSPKDMEGINNFTIEQYERLLNHENSHLNSSRTDFARAMNMYYSLRESRAEARAAAKRRSEHRKGRRARNPDQSSKQQRPEFGFEILSREESSPNENSKLSVQSPDTLEPTPTIIRPKKKTHKKSRPTWNVVLYDDDDDDDDADSLNNSLQQIESRRSGQSGYSAQSHRSGHYWQNRNSNPSNQRRSLEYRNRNTNILAGALDHERRSQNDQDIIPMSDPRLWSSDLSHGTIRTTSPVLANAELYPSNFDRNAAAAAAEEDRLKQAASEIQENTSIEHTDLIPTNDKTPAALEQQGSAPTAVGTNYGAGAGVGTETGHQSSSSTLQQSQLSNHSVHGAIKGAYQPLDDTTYIGQTSITRSESMDLPLCHLLISPPDTVKSVIRDDLSLLKNHIVVCADVDESLYRFLSTLRLAQISKDDVKTIVVLSANPQGNVAGDGGKMTEMGERESDSGADIDDTEQRAGGMWEAILSFPRVFWVAGNCRRQRDLVRAGILGASNIVIMSHRVKGLDRDEFEDTERSNIRFLNMRDLTSSNQSFDRQGIIPKFRRINTSNDPVRVNNGGFWMTPIFASGQVLVSRLLDNVLFQAYSKAHILDLVKLCCGFRFKQAIEMDQILGIDCSNICLIDPPAHSVGKPFLELFQALALGYGIVPLGLYRAPDSDLKNSLPFVFTNPLPGILLKDTDMIYVLKS